MKKLTLVKYDYKSFPKEWRKKNPNKFKGKTFMFLGEVVGMPEHAYLQCIETGKPAILHMENLKPLTEDEL